MDNHIHFSAIDCDGLQYVNKAECYVCLYEAYDLTDTDLCMRCMIEKILNSEREVDERDG